MAAQGSAGFDNLDISRVAERFCPLGDKRKIRPRGNGLWRIPHLQREPKPSQMKKPRHLLLSHLPTHLRNTAAEKKSTLRIYRKYARTSCCTLVVQSSCALPSGESGISVPTKGGWSHFWTCLSRPTGLTLCRPPESLGGGRENIQDRILGKRGGGGGGIHKFVSSSSFSFPRLDALGSRARGGEREE